MKFCSGMLAGLCFWLLPGISVSEVRIFPLDNISAYVQAPARWQTTQWTYAAATVAGAAAVYQFDEQLKASYVKNQSGTGDTLTTWGEHWAEGRLSGALMLGMYTYGLTTRQNRYRQAAWNMLEATLYANLTVETTKMLFRRKRPNNTEEKNDWFAGQSDRSMASGHAASAFSLASAWMHSFPQRRAHMDVMAYSLAALGAYGRLHKNKHWMSDVVIGSVIGYSTGYFVAKRNRLPASQGVSFQPALINHAIGIRWHWGWP